MRTPARGTIIHTSEIIARARQDQEQRCYETETNNQLTQPPGNSSHIPFHFTLKQLFT